MSLLRFTELAEMLELCDTYFKAVMTKMLQYAIMNALETCRNRNTQ